ncbi:Down syndrome cell adhesion molecule like protein [Eufriesea mexicana]|nr:Down syndrome cell adhesion molecule like protein [Eufriesea mexicana]
MCTTSQGDQPFNITWLMDDKPIQVRPSDGASASSSASSSSSSSGGSTAAVVETGNNIQISDYPPFSSILTINNVSAKHSGNYTCQISNVAGLAEYSTSLSVAVPPRWTVEPIDQNAVVGHGVSIACQAEGFPIPTVTWKQSIDPIVGQCFSRLVFAAIKFVLFLPRFQQDISVLFHKGFEGLPCVRLCVSKVGFFKDSMPGADETLDAVAGSKTGPPGLRINTVSDYGVDLWIFSIHEANWSKQ